MFVVLCSIENYLLYLSNDIETNIGETIRKLIEYVHYMWKNSIYCSFRCKEMSEKKLSVYCIDIPFFLTSGRRRIRLFTKERDYLPIRLKLALLPPDTVIEKFPISFGRYVDTTSTYVIAVSN